jgi:hypothetical protein
VMGVVRGTESSGALRNGHHTQAGSLEGLACVLFEGLRTSRDGTWRKCEEGCRQRDGLLL